MKFKTGSNSNGKMGFHIFEKDCTNETKFILWRGLLSQFDKTILTCLPYCWHFQFWAYICRTNLYCCSDISK